MASSLTPEAEALRRAIVAADPRLSRFDPLPRILSYCDFDDGPGGWATLIGNHSGDLDEVEPIKRDLRPAQLSACGFFDIGTHGSMDGTYALKLATRADPRSWSTAMKRLTSRELGLVRFETYFTFKAEQTFGGSPEGRGFDGNVSPSEEQFGFFTLMCDVWGGADDRRFLCALRYVNTDKEGTLHRKWMYKLPRLGGSSRDYVAGRLTGDRDDLDALSQDDWADVEDGYSPMCFNETATKINWHYLSWTFDTSTARSVELRVNEHVMDLTRVPVPTSGPWDALNHILNIRIDLHTHLPVRNFLFLDSTLISVDW